MEKILKDAIKRRKVVSFFYEGGVRIVEPFTLGVHKDTHNLVLCAYQIDGYSKSKASPPWRLYIVDQMEELYIAQQDAQSYREGYNPLDSRMREIIETA